MSLSTSILCTAIPLLDGRCTYCPKCMWILRVSNGNVASHAVGVPLARKDAEGEGHLLEQPLPMSSKRGMVGDSRKTGSLGDQLQGRLPFRLVLGYNVWLCDGGHVDGQVSTLLVCGRMSSQTS